MKGAAPAFFAVSAGIYVLALAGHELLALYAKLALLVSVY
jgi:hypothetical protein